MTMATADTASQARQAAAKVQTMHDQLQSALEAEDFAGISDRLDQLRPVLDSIAGQPGFDSSMDELREAKLASAELDAKIEEAEMAMLSNPIEMITGLVQGLLKTLLGLVGSLLGGGLPVRT
ncbi:hypothetical protein [Lentzea sp. NBRC 105346]|uniref:hypothetical protein n=1 Tax=Lentzea sp. NBRC 105346 TaxID=3032205 RepID=UPI0025569CCC|nr:hypothetical protein [Lentzea sp. NBRC 105346]